MKSQTYKTQIGTRTAKTEPREIGRRRLWANFEPALIAALLVTTLLLVGGGARVPQQQEGEASAGIDVRPGRALDGVLTSSGEPVPSPTGVRIPQFEIGNESSKPYYVEQVTARRTEDGSLSVYFTLRNARREVLASNGMVTLTITEAESGAELYSLTSNVTRDDFKMETIGRPPIMHETLLYKFPPITPDLFTRPPAEPGGKVTVTFFTVDVRVLEGDGFFEF